VPLAARLVGENIRLLLDNRTTTLQANKITINELPEMPVTTARYQATQRI
jgi:hypothetical protein